MNSDTPNSSAELPPDYYHQNFCQLLSVVQQRYADLLNEQEQQFLQQFYAASRAAQCLYVRLSGRSRSRFRLSKLEYAEIPDLLAAAEDLQQNKLLEIDPPLDTESLIPLFTKPELVKALKPTGGNKLSRAELDQQLIEQLDQRGLEILRELDTVLEVLQEQHLPIFKLCFFGNLYQDLSEFVLRDLAVYTFESYPLDMQSRQFSDRAQLDKHLQYYTCSSLREDAVLLGPESILALSDALPEPDTSDHSLERRIARLRNSLARDLERQQAPQLAMELYAQSKQPPARERRARLLMSAAEVDSSLALCREIIESPANEAEADFAQSFALRHAKRHNRHWPVTKSHKPPSKGIQLRRTDSVELDTAAHLEKDGDCFYVENTLFSSVLGLAIWPAIFTPIKGAFSHPFQHRPHDFYQPGFHQQRAELIQAELSLQIDDQKAFLERLLKRLELKRGVANPLVYWNAIDEQLLQKSLDRIAVAHWQVIFQRLLSDLRNHRNGLPDLIHFPSTGGYELVEVKGPGDRLQDNQKRWMAFFERHQIPHWVAQVSWIDND